jgi:hypothetical protein
MMRLKICHREPEADLVLVEPLSGKETKVHLAVVHLGNVEPEEARAVTTLHDLKTCRLMSARNGDLSIRHFSSNVAYLLACAELHDKDSKGWWDVVEECGSARALDTIIRVLPSNRRHININNSRDKAEFQRRELTHLRCLDSVGGGLGDSGL